MIIENAAVLATVTFGGGFLLWKKLPKRIKGCLTRWQLVTDAGICLLTYAMLGGSTTAILSAGIVGLLVSGALWLANNGRRFASQEVQSERGVAC